jgi:hypothetical protein
LSNAQVVTFQRKRKLFRETVFTDIFASEAQNQPAIHLLDVSCLFFDAKRRIAQTLNSQSQSATEPQRVHKIIIVHGRTTTQFGSQRSSYRDVPSRRDDSAGTGKPAECRCNFVLEETYIRIHFGIVHQLHMCPITRFQNLKESDVFWLGLICRSNGIKM